MKRTIVRTASFSIMLTATLIGFIGSATAQNYSGPPKRTVLEYGPPSGQFRQASAVVAPAPGKCGNPAGNCLFYGGDFLYDPLYPSIGNALANETTISVPGTPYGAATYVPFTVPAGEIWGVTGLFGNNLSTYGVLDQGTQPLAAAYWTVNEGVFPGSTGTVVASGTAAATSTPTGRAAFSMTEYTVQVTGLSLVLTPGSYWMAVVPTCTNTADPFCNGTFFLSDVEYINTAPANAFGPAEPVDRSFFDSTYFGVSLEPTNGIVGACGGAGCDAFSVGVLGRRLR